MSNSEESTFDRKNLPDGKANPKYVDVLDEDAAIAGQKFTCMSFLSPEKILTKRELFLFDRFIEQWDFTKSMAKFGDFINFISYKYNLNVENLFQDYNEFCKEEQKMLQEGGVSNDFQNFLDNHEEKLTEQFQREHAFQTSVRGVKVRGSFPTQEEAEQGNDNKKKERRVRRRTRNITATRRRLCRNSNQEHQKAMHNKSKRE